MGGIVDIISCAGLVCFLVSWISHVWLCCLYCADDMLRYALNTSLSLHLFFEVQMCVGST